jgi:hypothetical protein
MHMNKNILFLLLIIQAVTGFAQTQVFDITTYTAPRGWKKQSTESTIQYSKEDAAKGTYCLLMLFKALPGAPDSKSNFDAAWETVVKEMVAVSSAPTMVAPSSENGWEAQSGYAPFTKDGDNGIALLVTSSGFNKMVNILALTNSDVYQQEMTAFLESVSFKQLTTAPVKTATNPVKPEPANTVVQKNGFAFTTTNFDDGWTSTVQEDFVSVVKGGIKVLVHYPNKKADAYNSVLKEEDYNAWNTLVAPRYTNLKNLEWQSIQSWESITFMQGDATENATGKTVHIVLFKKHYSTGMGSYLEFVTDNKAAYENEFGPYHNTGFDWEKTANMQFRNKFAVGASDLKGKWTNNFTGLTQYVNANTGASAGADTHSSNQNFEFRTANTYKWDLTVANGFVGNIKFQNVKASGKFSLTGNWQVNFSEIEGKPKKYNAYFSCIKGARILWLQDTGYGDYSAFGKVD